MSIIACYSVYNEEKRLAESIDGIINHVDKLVFIDGRYYHESGCFLERQNKLCISYSTDRTLEIIDSYRHTSKIALVETHFTWPTEVMKRNRYFRFGKEGDWFFIIDGDEVAEGDVAAGMKFVRETKAIAVILENVTLGAHGEVSVVKPIRFFKWCEDIHYCRNHATIWGKNDKSISNPSIFCDKFKLINHHD